MPKLSKLLTISMIVIIFSVITTTFLTPFRLTASPSTSFTTKTDQSTYHFRQNVTISGNFTKDEAPVSEALIALDVRNPNDQYIAFRAIPIGNPDETWEVEITEALALDQLGEPTSKVKINAQMQLYVTIHNNLANDRSGVVTATVYDGNLIPLGVRVASFSLSNGETKSRSWSFYIPEWAYDGKATIRYNVYTSYPKDEGVPYAPEQTVEFYITRNMELDPPYPQPESGYSTEPGKYNIRFAVPPDRYTLPGIYRVYVTGRISPILKSYATTTFEVQSLPCPPQARFTYSPLETPSAISVSFDASSSSAEGYNDVMTSYEWYFDDWNNPEYLYGKTVQHTFEYTGIYVVSLNVTDNEDLWSITSKPIIVGVLPTANFTWSPLETYQNMSITFDASSSSAGGENDTLTSYEWYFDDWNNPEYRYGKIVQHTFEYDGEYNVDLNVTDNEGLWSTTSKPITILPESDPTANFTWIPLIQVINETVTFDASGSTIGWCARTQRFSPITTYEWNFSDGTGIINVPTPTIIDVNGDGKIDIEDIFLAALAFGSEPGDPHWDPRCDVNNDGKVDIEDVFLIALQFGKDP